MILSFLFINHNKYGSRVKKILRSHICEPRMIKYLEFGTPEGSLRAYHPESRPLTNKGLGVPGSASTRPGTPSTRGERGMFVTEQVPVTDEKVLTFGWGRSLTVA